VEAAAEAAPYLAAAEAAGIASDAAGAEAEAADAPPLFDTLEVHLKFSRAQRRAMSIGQLAHSLALQVCPRMGGQWARERCRCRGPAPVLTPAETVAPLSLFSRAQLQVSPLCIRHGGAELYRFDRLGLPLAPAAAEGAPAAPAAVPHEQRTLRQLGVPLEAALEVDAAPYDDARG
jgi:hypothetical protein